MAVEPNSNWPKYGRVICWICALSWFLTGVLYAWAGAVAPLEFRGATTFTPEQLSEFFLGARKGASLYIAAFAVFAVADFSLLLLASVLRELVGTTDFRAQILYVSVTVSMVLGLLVDLLLLGNWLVIQSFSAGISFESLAGLWVTTLCLQSISVWMSAASFVLGGLGLLLVWQLLHANRRLGKWAAMSLLFAGLVWLEVFAIVWDVAMQTSGMFTAVVFLLITNVVAPLWAIWLARLLNVTRSTGSE